MANTDQYTNHPEGTCRRCGQVPMKGKERMCPKCVKVVREIVLRQYRQAA
jgi:ribosomal protein L37E